MLNPWTASSVGWDKALLQYARRRHKARVKLLHSLLQKFDSFFPLFVVEFLTTTAPAMTVVAMLTPTAAAAVGW